MGWKKIAAVSAIVIAGLFIALWIFMLTYDFNRLKPRIVRGVSQATGRELRLGRLGVRFGLFPAVVVEDLWFENAPWGSRPGMLQVKRGEMKIALLPLILGKVQFRELRLLQPDFLIEVSRTGRSNLSLGREKEEKTGERGAPVPPGFALDEIVLENGLLLYRDLRSGKEFHLGLPKLSIKDIGRGRPVEMEINGLYQKEPFTAEVRTGPLEGLFQPEEPWPLRAKMQAGGAIISLEGRVKDLPAMGGVDLNFSARGKDLGRLQSWTGLPSGFRGPFSLSARIADAGPKAYHISGLNFALGPSDLTGSMRLNLAGERPRIVAELASQTLALETFLSPSPASPPGPKREKVFSKDPLPLKGLGSADVQVAVKAGNVLLPRLPLKNLDLKASLQSGRLTLKPLKAAIHGGTLEGWMEIEEKARTMACALKIDQFDLGILSQELSGRKILEGMMKLELDLKGRGASIADWMAGLEGRAWMTMGPGKIQSGALKGVGRPGLPSVLSRLVNALPGGGREVGITCFASLFDIRKGLAESRALVLDTPHMSMIGDGRIDLRTEHLDISLKPVPKESISSENLRKIGLTFAELASPLKLGGTLAAPSLALDPAQTALTLERILRGARGGPAGIAAALIEGRSGGENPCLAAVEAAQRGPRLTETPEKEKKPSREGKKGEGEILEKVEEELKKLFKK